MADTSALACPRSTRVTLCLVIGVTATLITAGCSGSPGNGRTAARSATAPTSVPTPDPSATPATSTPATPSTSTPATSGGASGRSPASASASRSGSNTDGGINRTVPSVERSSLAPVPLAATARFAGGVSARLVQITAVRGSANGPGEVAGPALRVVVRLTNGAARAITLDNALVTVTDSTGTPGVQLTQSGSAPFRGRLAAGRSSSGTYVFTLPTAHRAPVTLDFSYSSDAPVALFVGTPQ